MTNQELSEKIGRLIREERRITADLLRHLNLAAERQLHLRLGYASLFDWLVKGFGYSSSAAYRRLEAARLLRAVPECAAKLEAGKVNLTSLSKVESTIRAEERRTGKKLDVREEVIGLIENRSSQEAEKVLLSLFPTAALQDRRTTVDEQNVRVTVTIATAPLTRAKEVLSHRLPYGRDAEVIEFALEFLLEKLDPLRADRRDKRTSAIKAAGASCTYQDPQTGKVCGSRHQIEIDHIIPRALGGTDDPENLRVLCRQHNLHAAERHFGFMHKFRRE